MFNNLQYSRVHIDGPIWEVTIDRPKDCNALHLALCLISTNSKQSDPFQLPLS